MSWTSSLFTCGKKVSGDFRFKMPHFYSARNIYSRVQRVKAMNKKPTENWKLRGFKLRELEQNLIHVM